MDHPSPLDRRVPLAGVPTPVEPLDRLGRVLGKPPGTLWVKRDDMTGLGGGGNKARKLEYLCADALAQGCDTLVTGGGVQSNHVRMTAAAANRLGLACTILVAGERPDVPSGNVLLDEVLGPEIVWFGGEGDLEYEAMEQAILATAERLRAAGRRPYATPIGGASAVGALGYVAAAAELRADVAALDLPGLDLVVVADGSGGTHAGLAAGLGRHDLVFGVDVGARDDLDTAVPARAAEVAALAGVPPPAGAERFGRPDGPVDHERVGPAYGTPDDATREAILLAARSEGLILDPVYTGKAMAGLVAACREGRIPAEATVVFVHTGGLPALFATAYATWLRG
ncbi:MAG: D-cysteine desulfhydrase family protein [Acidimicrobiia bacterium]